MSNTFLLLRTPPHLCCSCSLSSRLRGPFLGFPRAYLLPPASPHPGPLPTLARPFLLKASDHARPCKPSPAPLKSEGKPISAWTPRSLSACPQPPLQACSPLPLYQLSGPHSLNKQNVLFSRHMPTSQTFCLSSQWFSHLKHPSLHPPQGLNYVHHARPTKNIPLAKNDFLVYHPLLNPCSILSHLLPGTDPFYHVLHLSVYTPFA